MEASEDPRPSNDGGGLIGLAIRRPVGVIVVVLLVMLFGGLSLQGLPIQLTPDIEIPTLTVTTTWPGASPAEVEREILLEQEEALKSVTGLDRMIAEAAEGRGTITLEFDVGTDIDEALVRSSNRLAQVPDYPDAAREPVLSTGNSAGPPLAVLYIQPTDDRKAAPYRTYAEQDVLPRLERIPGVAGIRLFGGRDSSIEVAFDPQSLAARGIPMRAAVAAIQGELRDVSGGTVDLGKQRYVVRTAVAPTRIPDLEQVVLRVDPDGAVVRLADVATVSVGLRPYTRKVLGNGVESMALLFDREAGSNVLEVTEEILRTIEEINEERLREQGLELTVVQDQTGYIYGALNLVRNNLLLGGALAVVVLLLFLRSVSASAVVSTAIPVCVMGTVLGMNLLGRSVNVVSLAGMAFAVGMVVDNAIVVLENIETWRSRGADGPQAALQGAREVWGAILASTLTTAAVFIPVITWQDEVGELLRDVAVAITLAVFLSLVVSVVVIPSLSARLQSPSETPGAAPTRLAWLDRLASGFQNAVVRTVEGLVRSWQRSLMVVVSAMVGATLIALSLLPPMEYLPTGNRNFMFGVLVPPPGYSVEEMTDMGWEVQGQLVPLIDKMDNDPPGINRTFYVALPGQGFMGASAAEPERIGELVSHIQGILAGFPGVFGIATQASLFGRSLGGGRTVDVEITGADLDELSRIGGQLMVQIQGAIPNAQLRPLPSLDAGGPELRILPDRQQAVRLGLNAADVGLAVDALIDGAIIGELGRPGEPQLDVILRARQEATSPGELMASPIATPVGEVVPLRSVATLEETLSPTSIRRIERRRSITIQVSPPRSLAIEEALTILREEVLPQVNAPQSVRIDLAGSADKLADAQLRMGQTLLLAVVISFLLMAALFEDFLAPLVILTTVPLAGAGGIIGLIVVDTFLGSQPLDMMTALGFIILLGVVVNNAILIVDGALARLRGGAPLIEATTSAVRGRVRPIFMSSMTSLAGLLPMVLFPGSGSELYRGVGAIVLGGLALSTVLTLFVVPSLFALLWRFRTEA